MTVPLQQEAFHQLAGTVTHPFTSSHRDKTTTATKTTNSIAINHHPHPPDIAVSTVTLFDNQVRAGCTVQYAQMGARCSYQWFCLFFDQNWNKSNSILLDCGNKILCSSRCRTKGSNLIVTANGDGYTIWRIWVSREITIKDQSRSFGKRFIRSGISSPITPPNPRHAHDHDFILRYIADAQVLEIRAQDSTIEVGVESTLAYYLQLASPQA
ncbi:hypothetical protein T4B_11549 [Trichinella pseudospiralis]|uniref:Uncharacterized protein n=1 Tax=Trichinella pseudospiralis TaxID=6337 RepID=A0A0V1JFK7_TRIPS|nr:hypothetical protein T4B_11549 [Trichinella pseudospiralis]